MQKDGQDPTPIEDAYKAAIEGVEDAKKSGQQVLAPPEKVEAPNNMVGDGSQPPLIPPPATVGGSSNMVGDGSQPPLIPPPATAGGP